MAKLRHIAVAVPDPERTAAFYRDVFDMEVTGSTTSELADGLYLSDGTICLALLRYRSDAAAGPVGRSFVGLHHVGFWCENLEEQSRRLEERGGSFFMDLPIERESLNFERKYRDPDGLILDISQSGWIGAAR